jgi:hypothetical protein
MSKTSQAERAPSGASPRRIGKTAVWYLVATATVLGTGAFMNARVESSGEHIELLPPPWHADPDQAGFTIWGVHVIGAGNVDNSGYSSLMVSAPDYTGDQQREGAVFLWRGSSNGLGAIMGTPSNAHWRAEGNQAGTSADNNVQFGMTTASVGDVNGDGYDDVLVGATWFNEAGLRDNGKVFLYLGAPTGLGATAAWTAASDRPDAHFGWRVGGAGDVNGDGFDDILVAEPSCYTPWGPCPTTTNGRVFLWLGGASGLGASGTPTNADWSAEFPELTLLGAVAGIGDVNNDGYDDIAVGSPWASNPEFAEGAVYVWYGSASGLGTSGTPANADWTAEANSGSAFVGRSVAGGDVNGDGVSDLVVGASGWDNGEGNEGAVFLWLGSAAGLGPPGNPDNAVWRAEANQESAFLGWSVAVVQDFSGDGYGDVMAGAWWYDHGETNEGAAFMWYGGPDGLLGVSSPADADWTAEADQAESVFGYAVADAGDLNGDGGADVIVGAYLYPHSGGRQGRAFVFYGHPATVLAGTLAGFKFAIPDFRWFFEVCLNVSFDLFQPGTTISKCPPPPICPQCVPAFDTRFKVNPAFAAKAADLYQAIGALFERPGSLREARNRLPLRVTADQFGRIQKSLAAVVPGEHSRVLRDSAARLLEKEAPTGRIQPRTLELLLATLNASDVEARSTSAPAAKVSAAKRVLVRSGGASLSFANTQRAGDVAVHAIPGLPATTPRIRTAWPVVHFVVDYTGQLEPNGHVTIALDVRTLGFDANDRALRLLEWDGKSYRDITKFLDPHGGTIRGTTDTLRKYVVARVQPASQGGR